MNFSCAALLLLCLAPSVQGLLTDDAKNRPVTKVVNLLKDMMEQLEKEAEQDEEVYEQMGCWCTTGAKDKTKSIADAEGRISSLGAAIEDMTASSARLNAEIGHLTAEVTKNTEALDKATALREKELAEFNVEEKDSLQTIQSLKAAVTALSKHHEASFLQTETTSTQIHFLKTVALMHKLLGSRSIGEVMSTKQRAALTEFVQAPYDPYGTGYSFTQGRAPASGEIFGILKQMKESFETNLSNSQKEEAKSQADFEALKAAKEEEIKAGQEQVDTKTQEVATTDEKNSKAKLDLEDSRVSLKADQEFLSTLKQRCQNVDQEYEERVKARQLELQAVSKALAFLTSDEAHDLFTRTFNPALVQTHATAQSKHRVQISKAFKAAAQKFNDPRLSMLAVRARLDAFAAVKKAITDLVAKLKEEGKAEIKHKDYCIEEIDKNERDTEMKGRDKKDLDAKVDDLAMTIDTLSKEIETLKAEIADLAAQLKQAGEDREKENKEFQQTVADQRATAKLIAASLKILKGFYDKAALVQEKKGSVSLHIEGAQAPPPGFAKQEKSAASGGVMGMMQGIVNDAKALEAEAVHAEEDAQAAYEDFVKETNASSEAKTQETTEKADAKAKAEGAKVQAEVDKEATMGETEQLMNVNADLHKQCDFTLKNFETRQAARNDEIGALQSALATFSGASFSAFLQK